MENDTKCCEKCPLIDYCCSTMGTFPCTEEKFNNTSILIDDED